MKNYIIEFKLTGEIDINISAVILQWNNRCSISQWKNEFTLSEDSWKSGKRGNRSKIKISFYSAFELIGKLNLRQEKSNMFNSGSVWRTAATERDYVMAEVQGYFQMNPTKKPSKFVQNVIDTLNIKL